MDLSSVISVGVPIRWKCYGKTTSAAEAENLKQLTAGLKGPLTP
jgi:hypothetical protein